MCIRDSDMLQVINHAIQEVSTELTTTIGGEDWNNHNGSVTGPASLGWYPTGDYWPYQTVYWNSYPVYVCTDKTKKAIEVLKALQADKLLKCDSVPRFIELVEKISNLL